MSKVNKSFAPLADRLRPQQLEEVVGQYHLVGEDGFLQRCIAAGEAASIILWGPPGCGKTTIARLYAGAFGAHFEQLSAVFSGVKDVQAVVKAAQDRLQLGQRTVLFVDEIHRFNKSQQDAFLPFVEDGTLVLVGATTENPSFELNKALLSRAQVLSLKALDEAALQQLITAGLEQLEGLSLSDEARDALVQFAHGDGRYLLNMLEHLAASVKAEDQVTRDVVEQVLQRRAPVYDKTGEFHYNLMSALHKAIRGSDPEASLYWLCRMLEAGEDPVYIARRLVRVACEDVGLADPQALPLAVSAREAYEKMGPEGELALAEVCVYLALAPKSISIYKAFGKMRELAAETAHLEPPLIIRNAPTKLMKDEGYGRGYQYDPDTPHGFSGQNYFPDDMTRTNTYKPIARGFEREMQKRLKYFDDLRKKLHEKS